MRMITLPDGTRVAPHAIRRIHAMIGFTDSGGRTREPHCLVETKLGIIRIPANDDAAAVALRDRIAADVDGAIEAPSATEAMSHYARRRLESLRDPHASRPVDPDADRASLDPHPDPLVEHQLRILRRTAQELARAGHATAARESFRQAVRVGCALGLKPYPHDDDPGAGRGRTARPPPIDASLDQTGDAA